MDKLFTAMCDLRMEDILSAVAFECRARACFADSGEALDRHYIYRDVANLLDHICRTHIARFEVV